MKNISVQKDWLQLKKKIRNVFGELSDSQIERLKGNMEQITSTGKKTYSEDKYKIEKDYREFKSKISKY